MLGACIKMVRWVEHAMYNPSLSRLVWTRVNAKPLWSSWAVSESLFPCPDPTVGSIRGQLIHALPWGTAPGTMAHAWKDLVDSHTHMAPFRTLQDTGYGLVKTLNYVLLQADHRTTEVRGTVDGTVALGDMWTGVEIKTGAWKYAPFWEKQITRHLTYYPRVLLVVVTPEAAQGKTPALVHLSS